MSIKVMSLVWDESSHKGSALLLLLAIADFADDSGKAWPSIGTLADKVRMSERQTIRLIKELENSHELVVEHNRATGNRYMVHIGFLLNLYDDESDNLAHSETDKPETDKPDTESDTGDTFESDIAMSHDPSSDPSIDPPAPKKARGPLGAKLLQATITVPEGERPRSSLAEYIGQQMGSPVPSGQCTKLAMTFTEQTTNGPVRHPSPDELWDKNYPGYRTYVAERVAFYRGIPSSPAIRRKRLVNRLCNYKAGDGYGWLDRERGKVDERVFVDV